MGYAFECVCEQHGRDGKKSEGGESVHFAEPFSIGHLLFSPAAALENCRLTMTYISIIVEIW